MRNARRSVLGMLVLTIPSLLTGGCSWPGKPDPADAPILPTQVTDFAVLFQERCSGCHGAEGKLGPAPPLNDALFLSIVPDGVLRRVISEGRQGTPMPAFAKEHGGPLTDKQVGILADGMKERWGKPVGAAKDAPSYLAPPASTKQEPAKIERGKRVFARACAVCHGDDGRATGYRIHDAAFLSLISDQALRRYVITGRPDLGMPNYAEPRDGTTFRPLSADEVDDLVALLSSWAPERPSSTERSRRPAGPEKGIERRGSK